MNDGVLSCHEVFAHFSPASAGGRPLSEGAQNALVNLYTRLSLTCPDDACSQRTDCVLHVDGQPKGFDGSDGKARFLRMKVRTEIRRLHRRVGKDVLTGGAMSFVGDDGERRFGAVEAAPWTERLADAAASDRALDEVLGGLIDALDSLDVTTVRGGRRNVVAAVEVARALVRLTAAEPLPERDEERREVVRALLAEAVPGRPDDRPPAIRTRQRRLRRIMRDVLDRVGGRWFADLWVALEENKRR